MVFGRIWKIRIFFNNNFIRIVQKFMLNCSLIVVDGRVWRMLDYLNVYFSYIYLLCFCVCVYR